MRKSESRGGIPWSGYARLMRLHRPIGTLLLLWPALWSLWLAAKGVPDLGVLASILLGTLLMRSAGCVINDYADRNFDGHVARTRERPLATGEVSPQQALVLFAVLVLCAGLLVLTLNQLTRLLSLAGLALAAVYPFMKRHTYLPQVWLGAAFGWAVPMSFAAQLDAVPPLGWLVLSAVVLWVLVYDTQYAMVDREDDLKVGIRSTAILFGDLDRQIIGALQVLLLIDLWLIGGKAQLGLAFDVSLLVVAGLFVHQQRLIHRREPAQCFKAFLNNNWVGAAVFAGVAVSYL